MIDRALSRISRRIWSAGGLSQAGEGAVPLPRDRPAHRGSSQQRADGFRPLLWCSNRACRHMGRYKSGDLKKFLISHEIRNFLVKSAGF